MDTIKGKLIAVGICFVLANLLLTTHIGALPGYIWPDHFIGTAVGTLIGGFLVLALSD
jgi:hypothetical protein